MIHELKVAEPWFERVRTGAKRAEVRKHDRDYQVGDTLLLYPTDQWGNRRRVLVERDEKGRFLNEYVDADPIHARITHVLPWHQFDGLAQGFSLISIEVVS